MQEADSFTSSFLDDNYVSVLMHMCPCLLLWPDFIVHVSFLLRHEFIVRTNVKLTSEL